MNRRIGLVALALVAGACYVAFSTPDAAPAQAARPDPNYFGFVHSMDGTKPDGDIKQNWDEQLVVDAELGHLFDYYLAGLGEQSLDAIRSQIEHELDQRLKPAPAAPSTIVQLSCPSSMSRQAAPSPVGPAPTITICRSLASPR